MESHHHSNGCVIYPATNPATGVLLAIDRGFEKPGEKIHICSQVKPMRTPMDNFRKK
jgi:hypothetical protein